MTNEKRLIDANALMYSITSAADISIRAFRAISRSIRNAPTVDAIELPSHGSTIEVNFNPGDMYGTMKLGDNTYQVYLGRMEIHQLGCTTEYLGHERTQTPSSIKHVFTLIQL